MKPGSSWSSATLGEVVNFPKGKDRIPVHDGSHPVLTFKGLQPTGELVFEEPISGELADGKSMTLLQPGDTVATNQGHTTGWILKKVGYIPTMTPSPVAAPTLQVFRPRQDHVTPRYLYQYLRWNNTYQRVTDTAGPRSSFTTRMFSGIQIPVPPLDDQKRIAGILDAADALRAKRREALARLDTLLQSTFLDMFGDPVTNPMGWEFSRIGDLGEVITGNTPSRKCPEYYGDAIEWIKSDNINNPSFTLTKGEEGLSDQGKKVARIAPNGSVLVTCIAGSKSCIGNAGIADREVAFNQQVNAFVPGERISLWFAFGLFLVGKRLVQRASTNSMKGMVSKSAFSDISVPLPPLDLQRRFDAMVESVEQQKARMRAHLTELDALFASLQSRAFNGEL